MAKSIKFERMDEPYVYGYSADSELGFRVEVVRCYESEWNVFLTRDGHVAARSVQEYRECGNGYLDKAKAFEIARSLV